MSLLTIDFAGRSFVLDAREGADLVAHQMADGSYEAPLPMLIMASVARTTGMFLDIGANTGLYSILASKARDGVKVAAFEPYPPIAEVLQSNLQANHIEDQVQVHPLALSDSTGTVSLFIPDPSHGLLETSASLEESFKPYSGTVNVEKRRLDDIDLTQPVSVIKIDIEGHEAACIYGARGCLERDRPLVFAEMLPGAARHFYKLSKMLEELDYIIFRLRPQCVIACRAVEHDPLSWNYGFVPREHYPLFRECCTAHGLELFRFYEEH